MKIKNLLLICYLLPLIGVQQLHAADFQSGDGSNASPYVITTAQQLDNTRNYLGTSNENVYFELGDNIDLTTFLADKPNGWEPLGRVAANGFYGKLDGKNKTISGLYINKQDSINVGLFGFVGKSAVIKNLTVTTDTRGVNAKFNQAGILIGDLSNGGTGTGEIANCTVSGLVQGISGNNVWNIGGLVGRNISGYIHHCHAVNIQVNGYAQIGGLTGSHTPAQHLHDCTVSGTINTTWSNTGGFIGICSVVTSPKNIYNCHTNVVINNSTRGYIGGFIGQNIAEGDIYDCSATAVINGNHEQIGGFIGRNSGAPSESGSTVYSNGTIRNCWAMAYVKGTRYDGGFVGRNYKRIVNCFAIVDVEVGAGYSGGFAGQNYHKIDSCYVVGSLSWSSQDASGVGSVGGFVGRNYNEATNGNGGIVANSYCAVNMIRLNAALATWSGQFFGATETNLPGILNNGNAIWNCYFNTEVSGALTTPGTVPAGSGTAVTNAISAAGMLKATSFPAFNFNNNTWQIWEGKSTPYFASQTTPLYVASINATGITAESKEDLTATDSIILYANGAPVALQSSVKNGKTWTGAFASGTISDGSILTLIRTTTGKAPAASVVKYETGADGFVDAQTLTIIGQAVPLNSYHRINVEQYPNLTTDVKNLLKNTAGIAVMFKTNSPKIQVRWTTGLTSNRAYVNRILEKGMDLYIKRAGVWEYAGVAQSAGATTTATIVENMDGTEKECLLYLPVYEEVTTLKIGIDPGKTIAPIPSPFKGKVIVYGTSITQGAAASRSGMAYFSRLSRETGINFINLGLSGNGTMPTADADMVASLDADAYILDCVANGTVATVTSGTPYIVNKIRSLHPNAPIIMKAGETRESGSFDETRRTYWGNVYAAFKTEYNKLIAAGATNLYYIDDTGFLGTDHEGTIDGTHPTDVGFTRMIAILKPQLLNILTQLAVFQ